MDAMRGVYKIRAYAQPVDVDAPIDSMPEYCAICTVQVAADTAEITGLHGKPHVKFVQDVFALLRPLGVKRVFWDRHKNGKVIKKSYEI